MKTIAILVAIAIVALLAWSATRAKAEDEQVIATTFVFVKIPESIMPIARGDKYEDPLDKLLQEAALGEVTGGGSQLGDPNPDGSAHIDWVGVDVELVDLESGLPFLKQELLKLGAPEATILEYQRGGKDVSETIGQP